jgi:hypothetical protein
MTVHTLEREQRLTGTPPDDVYRAVRVAALLLSRR